MLSANLHLLDVLYAKLQVTLDLASALPRPR